MLWRCDKWMWITFEYILACLNNFLSIQIRLIQFMRLMNTPEWAANHAKHWVHSLQSKTRSELDFSFVHIFSGAPRCAHALIKCVLSCCCCCCSWPTHRGAPKQRLILRPKCQLFSSAVPDCEREWERRERARREWKWNTAPAAARWGVSPSESDSELIWPVALSSVYPVKNRLATPTAKIGIDSTLQTRAKAIIHSHIWHSMSVHKPLNLCRQASTFDSKYILYIRILYII